MEWKLFHLLCLMLSMSCLCKGQNMRITCIEREQVNSQDFVVQAKTDELLSAMPKPRRVTSNRIENFFVVESSNSCVTYTQEVNIYWFHDIGYRDVQGVASLYWISFKRNRRSIMIGNQVVSKSFTFNDFQNKFEHTEYEVYYQDKKKNIVFQGSPQKRYIYVSLPICDSHVSEHIVFCFNKKGFIDHVRFYTRSPFPSPL